MKFILFDIDGTLMDSGGAGIRSLDLAFRDLFSIPDAFRTVQMAGKTDLQIIREGLLIHGLDSEDGLVPRFCEAYLQHLSEVIKTSKGHLKPGIPEILEALACRSDVTLGLLTGNLERGARLKLSMFGLNRFFPVGAYGDDDEDRNRLLPVAVEKLKRQSSVGVSFDQCVVIGDTPRDVACAKPYGAQSVAVATGYYTFDVLKESQPDLLLRDLSDTNNVLSLIC